MMINGKKLGRLLSTMFDVQDSLVYDLLEVGTKELGVWKPKDKYSINYI